MRRKPRSRKDDGSPSDDADRLLDEAIEQARREFALLPPPRAPSPEDVAALQQMFVAHQEVVAMVTAWRQQHRAETDGADTQTDA